MQILQQERCVHDPCLCSFGLTPVTLIAARGVKKLHWFLPLHLIQCKWSATDCGHFGPLSAAVLPLFVALRLRRPWRQRSWCWWLTCLVFYVIPKTSAPRSWSSTFGNAGPSFKRVSSVGEWSQRWVTVCFFNGLWHQAVQDLLPQDGVIVFIGNDLNPYDNSDRVVCVLSSAQGLCVKHSYYCSCTKLFISTF